MSFVFFGIVFKSFEASSAKSVGSLAAPLGVVFSVGYRRDEDGGAVCLDSGALGAELLGIGESVFQARSLVSRACGLSRKAIHKGIGEIEDGTFYKGRIRRPGAGRKAITTTDTALLKELEFLVEDSTRGDPESALRWTVKSTRTLAETLTRDQHPVSHAKVGALLRSLATPGKIAL